ncbi:MAG: DUF2807 domain-containing protein [Chitinophagaceae bacterium]|nr:DUF2807 domain-containing protein [Chitinophagaceae bacterium]
MKNVYAAILIALAVISLSSCKKVIGTGPVVSESRTTASFSEIEFSVPGSIRYIDSETREIIIEAQRNIIDVIETRVSDNKLKVYVRDNTNIRSHEEITITVKGPGVNRIALQGSGNLEIPGAFTPTNARLSISGSGNMTVDNIETNSLEVNISGSGNIKVRDGLAVDENITISGSGNVDLVGVEASTATTKTSGSGSITVFVHDELNARISGSGDVYYKGDPTVNVDVSGSGKVRKM